MILDGIKTEKELTKIITAIVDELVKEEKRLYHDFRRFQIIQYLKILFLNMHWQAELKIQIRQLQSTKKMILKILKKSTNRLVLATIELGERIN